MAIHPSIRSDININQVITRIIINGHTQCYERKCYFSHPEHFLRAFRGVIGSGPDFGEVTPPRVLVSLAAGVHNDVAMVLRPFEGAGDLCRVTLVDNDVDLARLTVGEVGQQFVQFVPLVVASLCSIRCCIMGGGGLYLELQVVQEVCGQIDINER